MRGIFPICERDFIVSWRNISSDLLPTIVSPLTFFLAFGFGLQGYLSDIEGVPYTMFVVPGLVSMTAVTSAFDHGAWSLWFHRIVQKTINEYRVNPISVYEIVIGKILSGFLLGAIKGIVVAIILLFLINFQTSTGAESALGLLMDYSLVFSHLLFYLLFVFLGSMIFSCVGTMCGTVMDRPEDLNKIQGVVITPLVFLAGLFFPLSSFPSEVLPLIKLLPTTAIFEGARQALLQGRVESQYILELFVYAAVSFILAVIIFQKYIEE